MKFLALSDNFIMPTKGSKEAAAFDIYMPTPGSVAGSATRYHLGFAAAIPKGYVALIFPRSGVGSKHGLELHNTCGVIDSDYRGEWLATLRTKSCLPLSWNQGERILQFLLVAVPDITPVLVDSLDDTDRGTGGLGSSGK